MKSSISLSEVKVNTSAIPTCTSDYIAMCTLREIRKFLAVPGNKEFLDRKIEERKARLAAAERSKHEEVLS